MSVARNSVVAITGDMRSVYILAVALFLFPLSAYPLEITGLQVHGIDHGEHVRIGLSARVKYNIFMTDDRGKRLIVDVPLARLSEDVGLPDDYEDPLIDNIRFSHHGRNSRIIFDFIEPVSLGGVKLVYWKHGYWLAFDVMKGAGSHHAGHHKYTEKAEKSSAEKPIIIIDAGHGGIDNGTSGYSGSKEKDLTLRYAKALKDALLDTGHYQVVLTRSDDRYLLLSERVKRAREAKGNLFISIHANSSPQASARGLSVYTISETASDKQSEELAEKENKADIIGGMDLSGTSKDVADILIDLTERETRSKSYRFADMLVKSFHHGVNLLIHPHRFAGFAVLKAPDIPSVLIEVGFLTNPDEEKQLRSTVYEDKILHDVVCAVDGYFTK